MGEQHTLEGNGGMSVPWRNMYVFCETLEVSMRILSIANMCHNSENRKKFMQKARQQKGPDNET